MNQFDPHSVAQGNLLQLSENPYPGRGIIVGLDETGKHLVQVYWIMGRSDNSRNRVFVSGENGLLATEAADPSKVKDPSLIIYNAMRADACGNEPFAVVSNGEQTDQVTELIKGELFSTALLGYTYEPDKPNFTPRITAVSYWFNRRPRAKMSILRKSPWSMECDRHFYEFGDLCAGYGHCLTTYSGDGDPLPSFEGEPILLPLAGSAERIASTYWEALNSENKVSLAVKFISSGGSSETVIYNKYKQVD